MPAATHVSVSEYLSTTYRPDREYVDGEIVERNMGKKPHSRAQSRAHAYLAAHAAAWGIEALVEQTVQISPTRYRIPDVCALLANAPEEEIPTHPPFLCVEILSKDDTLSSVGDRLDDFLRMGVENVWLIDPEKRLGYRYTADGLIVAKDGVMRTSNPAVFVPLSAIFE
jgi:Uma2 family endonuclease